MALDNIALRKNFESRNKDCKNDQKKAIKYVGELDLKSDSLGELILHTLEGEQCDAIQYALNNKGYQLFIALLNKVDANEYFKHHNNLLELAIESNTGRNERVNAVLTAYEKFSIPMDIHKLPEKTLQKLYDESWDGNIIKLLYNGTNSFFIPRGQRKAKMQSMIYFDACKTHGVNHAARKEAAVEADYLFKKLKDAGFKVPPPKADCTLTAFKEQLEGHLKSISRKTSVFVLCIMTHGDIGAPLNKNSLTVDIKDMLRVVRRQLPQHIPFALLIQSYHLVEPDQNVTNQYNEGDKRNLYGPASCPLNPLTAQSPETIVVTATNPGHSVTQGSFFRQLADQLRQSDGKTSLLNQIQRCSDGPGPVPFTQLTLRRDLILPRSLVYIEKKGESLIQP